MDSASLGVLGTILQTVLLGSIIFALLGQFVFDSIVLFVSMLILQVENKTHFFWSHIWKIFLLGGLVSIISAILAGVTNILTLGFFTTVINVVICGGLECLFHYFITFGKDESKIRRSMTLIYTLLAIIAVIW